MLLAVTKPPVPLLGERTIFPVVSPPIVKVLLAAACMFPPAPRTKLPAIVAVGVPEFMFNTANFADEEVVPPTKRSRVELPGYRVPAEEFQNDPPFAVGRIPETSAVARSTALVVDPEPMNIEEVNVSETYASVKAVPFHTPDTIVPTEVKEEPVTPEPRVVAESTEVPAI